MRQFTKLLKPKNSLKLLEKTKVLIDHLKEEVKDIDVSKLKYSADLVERVCCLVESEFASKPIDKKQKVFEILTAVLSITLTDEDKRIIGELINHLHATGRIKSVSLKSVVKMVARYFLGV